MVSKGIKKVDKLTVEELWDLPPVRSDKDFIGDTPREHFSRRYAPEFADQCQAGCNHNTQCKKYIIENNHPLCYDFEVEEDDDSSEECDGCHEQFHPTELHVIPDHANPPRNLILCGECIPYYV